MMMKMMSNWVGSVSEGFEDAADAAEHREESVWKRYCMYMAWRP